MGKILFLSVMIIILFTGCNNTTQNVSTPTKSKIESIWISDNNGCKVYNPNPAPNETITWSGSCKDGYATGEGLLQWYVNGKYSSSYNGIMLNGKYNGKGIANYPDGAKYEGDWKDSKRDGKGIMTYSNGAKYEGEFKNNLPNGKGVITQANGTKEEGYYKDGNRVSTVSVNGVMSEIVRINSMEVVYDGYKNLMWQDNQDVLKIIDWYQAESYCSNLNFSGYNDWRLPSKNELLNLVDSNVKKKIKNANDDYYWSEYKYSSTMWGRTIEYAAYIHFNSGSLQENPTYYIHNVRCVRNAQLTDSLNNEIKKSKNEAEQERIETNAYNTASSINSINSYKEYLKKFPNGKYVQSAKNNMYDLTPEGIAKRKKEAEIAAKERKKEEERERVEKSNSQTTSSSSYNYIREMTCSFCCTGQWGGCTSDKIEVKVKASNISEAIDLIRNKYENACEKIPFFKGSGYGSSVGYPNCN